MRKADLVVSVSEKTGVPKVDVLVAMEAFFKEVKISLSEGENVYIRGFGSFIIKKGLRRLEGTSKEMLPSKFLNISFPHLNQQKFLLNK